MRTEVTATAGATTNDYFGLNTSCTTDGKIVATGTGREDGSTTGVNAAINNGATDAGCVMVFQAP